MNLHTAFPAALIDSVAHAKQNLRRTRPSADAFIAAVERQNLAAFAAILKSNKSSLI